MMIKSLVATAAAVCVVHVAVAKPIKVLMIGNSFSSSVMRETPNIAKAAGLELDIVQCGIAGCSLEKHLKNVEKSEDASFKPYEIIANITSDPSRNFPAKANITDMLVADGWDIVTIQQASGNSAFSDTYEPYAEKLMAKIRELAPRAEIVIQETWSYSPYEPRLAKWNMSPEDMYNQLQKAYARLSARYGLRMIPTGDAVQLFRDRLPVRYGTLMAPSEVAVLEKPVVIDFHGDVVGSSAWRQGNKERQKDWEEVKLRNDYVHLNARGVYLQACVWVGFLFKIDPVTITYRPRWVTMSDAKLMRECARDALLSSGTSFEKH